jgi:hypothetical protein
MLLNLVLRDYWRHSEVGINHRIHSNSRVLFNTSTNQLFRWLSSIKETKGRGGGYMWGVEFELEHEYR